MKRVINRKQFDTNPISKNPISLAYGLVKFPDGKHCRFNVRLQLNPLGDVCLIAEDINRDDRFAKSIKLRRKK